MLNIRSWATAISLFSCAVIAPGLCNAQAQGQQQGGFQGQGGPGGPGGQGGGGFQGRGGPGGGGQRPMINGTITGGDAAAGTITISTQFGGSQVIKVSTSTKYQTQKTITVADLKVGDQVRVQGVPLAITASSIIAGDLSDIMGGGPNGGRNRPGAQPNQGNSQNGPGGQFGPGGQGGEQSFATAVGKVASTSPLTIRLSSDVSVVLKLASTAKISKITTITFSNLNVGDKIMANGQTGSDGTLSATTVSINMQLGGGPGGGPGGPGGPGGGPGGPGGPGGDGGGPGGPGGDGQGGPPPPPNQQ